ncbi:hypothetical protein [Paracoccus sulfuroxidans]|uniref:Uncharacterized protein n=1 Tax=Paracoccus sulfuroxidans TaxID=384678 RepID=A0A562NSN7_9RHOB|nr:hypothetical protein [Paracoccus sulfuroxidans]TWI35143.1 hypothetical protein IQ24_01652 [Paracoccus sulfuroxidans]
MVTAVTGFANTAASFAVGSDVQQAQQPTEPALSDMAQSVLDSVSRLHNDFEAGMQNIQVEKKPVHTPNENPELKQMFDEAVQQMGANLHMQAQLVQFSMATSISQSLGNNLNSFLKGS